MTEEYTERVGKAPVDFEEVILRQLLEIDRQMSSGNHGIDAIRALHLNLRPYRDEEFKEEMIAMVRSLKEKRENGLSHTSFNTQLADNWLAALMGLLERRSLIPHVKQIRRGEELLQGV